MGATPRFCDVDLAPSTSTSAQIEAADRPTDGRHHPRPPVRPVRRHGRGQRDRRAPRALGGRGRRLRVRRLAGRPARRHPRRRSAASRSTRASRSPPARAACSPPRAPTWHELARSLRDHGADRSDLARHGAGGAFLLADFDLLGFNYRMTDLQGRARLRADGPRRLDPRRARAGAPRSTTRRWPTLDVAAHAATCRRATSTATSAYCCLFAPEEPTLRGECRRAARVAQPR